MITLAAHNLCWIKNSADDPADQCAHGRVEFRVNDTLFLKPEDGEWTVSGAVLYLMRTIKLDHSASNSVAESNFLFPCCAFNAWPIEEKFKVVCMGCNHGIDFTITHVNDSVVIESPTSKEVVSQAEWQMAVLAFAKQVRDFYDRCKPKEKIEDKYDREGWAAFWQEWDQRYHAADRGEA